MKIIEELNDQYSIREDGVIIRHYHINPKTSKTHYKDHELKNRASTSIDVWLGQHKKYRINTLLRKYFNTYCCSACKKMIKATKVITSTCNNCLEDQTMNNIVLSNDHKFIKGTNNQYSIGIDGSIIRYFRKANASTILFKNTIIKGDISNRHHNLKVQMNINGKCVSFSVKYLVAEYFDLYKPFINNNRSHTMIINIDNNPRNCNLSNLQWIIINKGIPFESIDERQDYFRKKALAFNKTVKGRLIKRNHYDKMRSTPEGREHLRITSNMNAKTNRINLSKCYVASSLQIPIALLTTELYESHKALLKLKRLLANKENISVYSFNNLKL